MSQKYTQAIVTVLVCQRRLSNFMARSGLGITSVGTPHTLHLDYKVGEVVDEKRILDMIDKMNNDPKAIEKDILISCPKIISITEIQLENEPTTKKD